jgi:lambda repressor-like predicted transcriptional regulator
MAGYSYKELLNQETQALIRARLLTVNRKTGHSIANMAQRMSISPTTLRSFLVDEKKAIYSVISKILGFVEEQELKTSSTDNG